MLRCTVTRSNGACVHAWPGRALRKEQASSAGVKPWWSSASESVARPRPRRARGAGAVRWHGMVGGAKSTCITSVWVRFAGVRVDYLLAAGRDLTKLLVRLMLVSRVAASLGARAAAAPHCGARDRPQHNPHATQRPSATGTLGAVALLRRAACGVLPTDHGHRREGTPDRTAPPQCTSSLQLGFALASAGKVEKMVQS